LLPCTALSKYYRIVAGDRVCPVHRQHVYSRAILHEFSAIISATPAVDPARLAYATRYFSVMELPYPISRS
jgi:hypothetical protein